MLLSARVAQTEWAWLCLWPFLLRPSHFVYLIGFPSLSYLASSSSILLFKVEARGGSISSTYISAIVHRFLWLCNILLFSCFCGSWSNCFLGFLFVILVSPLLFSLVLLFRLRQRIVLPLLFRPFFFCFLKDFLLWDHMLYDPLAVGKGLDFSSLLVHIFPLPIRYLAGHYSYFSHCFCCLTA